MSAQPKPSYTDTDLALTRSPNPELRQLRATVTDDKVLLTGFVSSYYLKQLAQETVKPTAGTRRVVNQIKVGDRDPDEAGRGRQSGRRGKKGAKAVELPPPLPEEIHTEWNRFFHRLGRGEIDPEGQHSGQYVAFYDDRVIDYGPDPVTLREAVAALLGVHPERVVISYLDV